MMNIPTNWEISKNTICFQKHLQTLTISWTNTNGWLKSLQSLERAHGSLWWPVKNYNKTFRYIIFNCAKVGTLSGKPPKIQTLRSIKSKSSDQECWFLIYAFLQMVNQWALIKWKCKLQKESKFVIPEVSSFSRKVVAILTKEPCLKSTKLQLLPNNINQTLRHLQH